MSTTNTNAQLQEQARKYLMTEVLEPLFNAMNESMFQPEEDAVDLVNIMASNGTINSDVGNRLIDYIVCNGEDFTMRMYDESFIEEMLSLM